MQTYNHTHLVFNIYGECVASIGKGMLSASIEYDEPRFRLIITVFVLTMFAMEKCCLRHYDKYEYKDR